MHAASNGGEPLLAPTDVRASARAAEDERLVGLVREGNVEAFEQLYDRYAASITAFCRSMLGSTEDGEDAAQQTFISAHRALTSSSQTIVLRHWLFAIARNRSLDLLRGRRAVQPLDAHARAVPAAEGLLATVARRESMRTLMSDLAALPEDQRSALVLFELAGLSHNEVAEVLGRRPSQVKALIHQGRVSLAADRSARQLDCVEIREQLANARRHDRLRAHIRRHLRVCAACRAFADVAGVPLVRGHVPRSSHVAVAGTHAATSPYANPAVQFTAPSARSATATTPEFTTTATIPPQAGGQPTPTIGATSQRPAAPTPNATAPSQPNGVCCTLPAPERLQAHG